MICFSIGERELREASRRGRTYRVRLIAASLAVVVGTWVILGDHVRQTTAGGGSLFVILSGLAFLFTLFAGVFFTADCLSSEKREGTLGLLFLTDLRNGDVVIGKLLATSLDAFYGVLAVLPVMALPMLVGGVTLDQFWRMVLVLANTLLFSLSLGLLVSAIFRNERVVMGVSFGSLAFFGFGPGMIQALVSRLQIGPTLKTITGLAGLGHGYYYALDINYATGRSQFWSGLKFTHGLAWLLLFGASFWLGRAWRRDLARGNPQSGSTALELSADWSRLAALRDAHPFDWLASRGYWKRYHFWLAAGTVLVVWGLVSAGAPLIVLSPATLGAMGLMHLLLKCWLAAEASHRFATDRASGNLELLLATRLTPADLLRGQLSALRRRFIVPLAAVTLMDLVVCGLAGEIEMKSGAGGMKTMLTGFLLWMVLLADLYALAWVGMWSGFSTARTYRAILSCLARVLLVPAMIFAALIWLTGPMGSQLPVLALAWLAITIITNLFFWVSATTSLEQGFKRLKLGETADHGMIDSPDRGADLTKLVSTVGER